MKRGVRLALLASTLAFGQLAHGATFGLSPMRVDLAASATTAVVNVTNSGDAPLTIQIQPHAWSQSGGKDVYGETRDVIASPPIFTMPPGARQVVRIALRGATPATVEQSYRLIFREVPTTQEGAAPAAGADGGSAFRIAVGMDIPMYVAPAAGAATPQPQYALETAPDGTARVRIGNDGSGHLRLAELVVSHAGEALASRDVLVVLAGAFAYVDLPKGKLTAGRPVDLRARTSGGTVELSLDAARP
jgi:fimbrial chaperone protein